MAISVPQSREELLEYIRDLGIEKTCSRFRRPPVPTALLRALYEEPEAEGLYFIARYPLSPSDLLESMVSRREEAGLMTLLAANPRTPPPVLLALINHPSPAVRGAVAVNPNLTPREILKLLRDDHPEVVEALARNPGLKIQHQAFLIRHPETAIRKALAENPNLDPEMLRALGDDPHEAVRQQVASFGKADNNLLQLWADGDDYAQQIGLLERKKLPESVIRSLALSDHPEIRIAVEQRFELTPDEWVYRMERGDEEELTRLASWNGIPSAIQRSLCQKESAMVRISLAGNPSLDSDIAAFLAESAEPAIGLALLNNPKRRESWIDSVARWSEPQLDAAITYVVDVESPVLHELINVRQSAEATLQLAAQQKGFAALRGDLATALARHRFPALRALAASSLQLPSLLLLQLAEDPIRTVSSAARSNPNFRPDKPQSEPSLSHTDQRIRSWLERIDNCLKSI